MPVEPKKKHVWVWMYTRGRRKGTFSYNCSAPTRREAMEFGKYNRAAVDRPSGRPVKMVLSKCQ